MTWIYQNKEITEPVEGMQGYVYLLTLPDGTKYIGKKNWWIKGYKQVNKKRKSYKKESDWKDYYGSSDYFKELVEKVGKENVKREILHLCKTKAEESYWESYEIFVRHALLKDDYANGWISCRITKKHVFCKINY